MWSTIKDIDKTDLFIYIVILILTIVLVTRINPSSTVLIGLTIGVIVVYILHDRQLTEQTGYVKNIVSILKSPLLDYDRNTHLHKDALLVEFLETYKEYADYNPQAYKTLTKQIDNLLKLSSDIENGSENYTHDFDVLLDTKTKILNTYHSFIYKVPHIQSTLHKFHKGKETLLELVNDHIDHVNRIVIKQSEADGVTLKTKFYYRSHPKPTDPDWHPSGSYY
jgi:hypothetical protein